MLGLTAQHNQPQPIRGHHAHFTRDVCVCVCTLQISDMEQHMEDALTLPVTAVKAAFNLTKAIIAPDGRCLAASAGGSRQRVKQVSGQA